MLTSGAAVEAWLNQHIFSVLFDENEWDKKFLQFAFNQNLADCIRAAHGGAGLAHITKGRFEESAVNLQRATRLRQSILQKAFTGDLVSPEARLDGAPESGQPTATKTKVNRLKMQRGISES